MNVVQEMLDQTQQEIDKMPPVNVMLLGKTGIGKSTLINSVFREKLTETGIGRPVTQHLRKIEKKGVPIGLYDTKGLELNRDSQAAVLSEINGTIDKLEKSGDPDEAIHVMWFCVNANSNRLEDSEISLIHAFAKKVPVIIVMTQSFGKNADEFKKAVEEMNLPVAGIQAVLAEDYEIMAGMTVPAHGLIELVEKTYHLLPEGVQRSFTNAQKVDIERKIKEARKFTAGYVASAFGAGFTPIPFADAAVLVPIQVTMLAHITAIFGVSMNRSMITSVVAAVGGTAGATFIGRTIVSNALKFIPGVGTVAGGLISGGTASMITTALAFAYIQVLAKVAETEYAGKKMDADTITEMMKSEFKKYAKLVKKEKKNKES